MIKNISIFFFSILIILSSCTKKEQNEVKRKKINKEIKRQALDFPPHYSLPQKFESESEDLD